MLPVDIATRMTCRGRRIGGVVAVEPFVNVIQIYLLGPEQPRKRLPLNAALIFGGFGRMNYSVKLIRLFKTLSDYLMDISEGRDRFVGCETQRQRHGAAGRNQP